MDLWNSTRAGCTPAGGHSFLPERTCPPLCLSTGTLFFLGSNGPQPCHWFRLTNQTCLQPFPQRDTSIRGLLRFPRRGTRPSGPPSDSPRGYAVAVSRANRRPPSSLELAATPVVGSTGCLVLFTQPSANFPPKRHPQANSRMPRAPIFGDILKFFSSPPSRGGRG